MLRQNLHARRRQGQDNVGQRQEKPQLDGIFRPDRIPKNLPVHFRGNVQPTFRHTLRTKQLDSVEFNFEHFDAQTIDEDQTTQPVRYIFIRVREKITIRTIRKTQIERRRFRGEVQTSGRVDGEKRRGGGFRLGQIRGQHRNIEVTHLFCVL